MKKEEKGVIQTLLGFSKRIMKDHVGAYAAQSAYFIVLSFIPFVLCLMAIVQYTPLTKEIVQEAILQICPENLEGFINSIIDEVYNKSSAVIPVSAVFALWSAGRGLQSVTNGLNTIYHVKETRNWLATRIRSMFYTLALLLALLLSLILLVFGNNLQRTLSRYVPFLADVARRVMNARSFLVFIVLFAVFCFLFKVIPNRKATFRSQIPGALLTALAWMTFSYGFSLYFTFFSNFSNMYGSMTTVILVMLWLYVCMTIVLYGAEVNAYFEKDFRHAHEFARDLFDMEDGTSEQLQKNMDTYFEEDTEKENKKK